MYGTTQAPGMDRPQLVRGAFSGVDPSGRGHPLALDASAGFLRLVVVFASIREVAGFLSGLLLFLPHPI